MKPSYIIELPNQESWKLNLPEGMSLVMNDNVITTKPDEPSFKGKLIILCGPAKSGKSTIAKELVNYHYWQLEKFADPLKDMLRVLGLQDEEIEGKLKEVECELLCGKTPRHAMQTLGTEWGRKLIGEDLWVRAWTTNVRDLLDNGWDVVVDDCRFDNELEAALALGGKAFYLVRDGAGIGDAHESERGISADKLAAMTRIYNDSTPDEVAKHLLYNYVY